jgi:AGCS family alanine or glycine:cation symporter
MWITAVFGMAPNSEKAYWQLNIELPTRRVNGRWPMYYIEKGLGWKWLAVLFAIFGSVAAFGIGNLVQVNSVAGNMHDTFGINPI